jgi:hypothetical protein
MKVLGFQDLDLRFQGHQVSKNQGFRVYEVSEFQGIKF